MSDKDRVFLIDWESHFATRWFPLLLLDKVLLEVHNIQHSDSSGSDGDDIDGSYDKGSGGHHSFTIIKNEYLNLAGQNRRSASAVWKF